MSSTTEKLGLLIVVSAGAFLLLWDDRKHSGSGGRDVSKEKEFIGFNKNSMFKHILQAEEHLHNLVDQAIDVGNGEGSCVIKHLAIAEGHADEAVSHTADLVRHGDRKDGTPTDYKRVGKELFSVRENFQSGRSTPIQAISELRDVRRDFESFTPELDITKCKACKIHES